MAKIKRLFAALSGICLSIILMMQTSMTVMASGNNSDLQDLRGGIAALLNPTVSNTEKVVSEQAKMLNVDFSKEVDEPQQELVMANVKYAVNIRSEAVDGASKIGKFYKDCGGTVLEKEEGWTKIQTGNLIGWAPNEYLLFGEEAEKQAKDVGHEIATVLAESLRVRMSPDKNAAVYGLLPQGEIAEVLDREIPDNKKDEWICVDYEGKDGYVLKEFVEMDFIIDTGKTNDEIKAQAKAEKAANKKNVNYGAYTTDADTTLLLAALIHCEAGGEPYEGQVAVGAVVLNRVRSSAYPNTIHEVIYASGQFTPAMSGKVNRVLESGRIYESCIKAAEEALSGVSNVGDLTHFRRVNGREGLIIGNHVFY